MALAPSWARYSATVALVLAVAAVLLLLLAGPGTKWGWWHYRTGLGFLRYAAWLGMAGIGVSLVALIGGARGRGAIALVLALACLAVPFLFQRRVKQLPMIHDISTDTEDPPAFVAALPLRAGAANPPEYAGAEAAAKQRAAYPDIQPIDLADPPARAFERALAAVRAQGWEIAAEVSAEGRIEAVATTPFFGFKDDVVIRIRPQGSGSRVDVRSKSRVGRSDVGANAARIRRFRKSL